MDKKIKMIKYLKYSARQTNIIFNAKIQIVFCESELWTIIGFLYRERGRWKGKSSKIRSREEPPLMRTDVRVTFETKKTIWKKSASILGYDTFTKSEAMEAKNKKILNWALQFQSFGCFFQFV